MTASALATEQGIAMALRQGASGGRHRKKSNAAASWTMPRENKTPGAVVGKGTPRHRKASPAAGRTGPRHRKKGRASGQAVYLSFATGQGNSIRTATRRVALPSAFALGVLAVGSAITAGFSMPSPDAMRADGSGPGGMMNGAMPPPPALTVESTPSAALPPMADRGVRAPMDGSGPAWPIIDQSATVGDVAGEPAQNGTTTRVRDRAPDPGPFEPAVTADPSVGHGGGGGGPAESSVPTEPPAVDGGALPDVFGPGGLLDDLGDIAGGGRDSGEVGNTAPGWKGADRPSRADRPGGPRDWGGGRVGTGRGFGGAGKIGDAGSRGDGNSDGHSGGGQGRHAGGRR